MKLTEDITVGSAEIFKEASDFTADILKFEEWLVQLPGRVPAAVVRDDLAIRLHRHGKRWKLECATKVDQFSVWKPLSEASLLAKMASVDMMEELLIAVHQQQNVLVGKVVQARRTLAGLTELLITDSPSPEVSEQESAS